MINYKSQEMHCKNFYSEITGFGLEQNHLKVTTLAPKAVKATYSGGEAYCV